MSSKALVKYDKMMSYLEDYCMGKEWRYHTRPEINEANLPMKGTGSVGQWNVKQILWDEALLSFLGCLDSGLL